MIETIHNINADNSEYDTNGGNDTYDNIYLLSEDMLEDIHFELSYSDRMWWLRSPGERQYDALYNYYNGVSCSERVSTELGVRPALTLKLE